MVVRALRAGEHGVVVGAARRQRDVVAPNRSPLTLPTPVTMPSVGNLRMTSSHGQPGARRQHELPVFDERAGVAQIVDVLARRALLRLAALRDRVGPGGVERDRVALEHLGEIGPDAVEVDRVFAGVGADAERPSAR